MANNDDFDFDKELDEAEGETLDQFSQRISKKTKLKPEVIKIICPTKPDEKALEDLIGIVSSATSANEQKAQLVKNAEKLGGVLLGIAKKFILPV